MWRAGIWRKWMNDLALMSHCSYIPSRWWPSNCTVIVQLFLHTRVMHQMQRVETYMYIFLYTQRLQKLIYLYFVYRLLRGVFTSGRTRANSRWYLNRFYTISGRAFFFIYKIWTLNWSFSKLCNDSLILLGILNFSKLLTYAKLFLLYITKSYYTGYNYHVSSVSVSLSFAAEYTFFGPSTTWAEVRAMHPKFDPDRCSNSWPLDHGSTFHVTETPALATWPSVTKNYMCTRTLRNRLHFILHVQLRWMHFWSHEYMINKCFMWYMYLHYPYKWITKNTWSSTLH